HREFAALPCLAHHGIRHIEHRFADIGPRDRDYCLAGGHDLPDVRADGGNDSVIVGAKIRIAELNLRSHHAGFRLVESPLRAGQRRDGRVDLRLWRGARLQQQILTPFLRPRIDELRLSGCEVRLSGGELELDQGAVERGEALALRDEVADRNVAGDDSPADLEAELGGVARRNRSGEGTEQLRRPDFDRRGQNRPHWPGRIRLPMTSAGGQKAGKELEPQRWRPTDHGFAPTTSTSSPGRKDWRPAVTTRSLGSTPAERTTESVI